MFSFVLLACLVAVYCGNPDTDQPCTPTTLDSTTVPSDHQNSQDSVVDKGSVYDGSQQLDIFKNVDNDSDVTEGLIPIEEIMLSDLPSLIDEGYLEVVTDHTAGGKRVARELDEEEADEEELDEDEPDEDEKDEDEGGSNRKPRKSLDGKLAMYYDENENEPDEEEPDEDEPDEDEN